MKRIGFLLFAFMLSACNCHKEAKLMDGFNEVVKDDNRHIEEYIYKGQRHGIFIDYIKHGPVYSIGTYQFGYRDGLWDTAANDPKVTQVFYSNGEIIGKLNKRFCFKIGKAPLLDFAYLDPVGWQLRDSLISKNILSSVSPFSDRNVHPWFVIYKLTAGKKDNLKDLVDDYYQKELRDDSSIIEYTRVPDNTFSYSEMRAADTLFYAMKVIKTKNGVYQLGCGCSYAAVEFYRQIFKTMTNGFTPLSAIEQ